METPSWQALAPVPVRPELLVSAQRIADPRTAPITWNSIYMPASFPLMRPDNRHPNVMAGLMWQPDIPPIAYAMATTDKPNARAVPITVAARLGSDDVHDKLTAVPQPIRTRTMVPTISAMYFFMSLLLVVLMNCYKNLNKCKNREFAIEKQRISRIFLKSVIFALMKLEISDWKIMPYADSWKRQTEWFDALVHAKQAGEEYVNHIVLCEHPHVYTLGRSGKEGNMLLSDEQLGRIGATLYHIDRGGDITYHGPGQLVCYPILNLEEFSLGLKEYVHLLEEAVIRVCASYGITAGRLEKATGVWLEGDSPRARKICAIGVRSSHYVTMHGLALNVNTDLRYFSYIHPCGFIDKGVTSLQKELGCEVPMEEVKERLCKELTALLQR